MKTRRLNPSSCLAVVCMIVSITVTAAASDSDSRPNVVLIITDDLGYGDIGCFGNTTIRTPHLDKLASQGVKLTHSIAAATMCSPSRAAFLTGRYPIRTGMLSAIRIRAFVFTASAGGLPASEVTIGEVAKQAGYRTAFLGKWHQGWSIDRSDPSHYHPLNQGFDYFYGIPVTNFPDFGEPYEPVLVNIVPSIGFQLIVTFAISLITIVCLMRVGYLRAWSGILLMTLTAVVCGYFYLCFFHMKLLNSFMFRNYDIVEQPIHLPSVTQKMVKEGEDFLQARHVDGVPFLLLVSWLHVHTALATARQFTGRSSHGPYGDAVEEMDWGVGQLMEMLDRYGMRDNTLVYFTSDHGGASKLKDLNGRTVGGHNGPFSGIKGEGSTEGSFRVPGIIRWPARLTAGSVLDEPVSMMDIFPTLADLLHVPLPGSDGTGGHVIDGRSLMPLLTGQESVSPHEFLFHYGFNEVHAVRYRPRKGNSVWKLVLQGPDPQRLISGSPSAVRFDPPKLYDLTSDPTAMTPLDPEAHADVVRTMLKALKDHEESVEEVPCQFSWRRVMWQPWNQPCCDFPRCSCKDGKFTGMFSD